MTTSTSTDTAPTGPATDRVSLDLPADPRHAATARVVVASLAADAGFSVDEIDDLRLALNEAVALLLDDDTTTAANETTTGDGTTGDGTTGDGGIDAGIDRVAVELVVGAGHIEIDVRRPVVSDVPEIDSLADRILTAVVDQHVVGPGLVRLRKTAIGATEPHDARAGTRPAR